MCLCKKKYGIITQSLLANGSVIIPPETNSITIINIGITLAMVNLTIPLNPGTPGTNNGESITIGGNEGEIFNGRIDISFPTGAVGNVVILHKIYL